MSDPTMRGLLWQNLRRWDGFLALGFGSGLAPRAPGTFGTLVAVPLAVALKQLPVTGQLAVIVLAFLLGVWICDRVGKRLGVTDHGAMVWDEFVGYWLAVLLVPGSWPWLLAGFVLFRFFDILKPWPIRVLEKRLPGGLGVMFDDVIAGVMAGAVLLLAARFF